ncbi:MAG: ComEC/Rec2 family competence protein [Arthrobacter sp.]|nr:ComEC/Rec2 family competence protein [Arthrobacter sp.]
MARQSRWQRYVDAAVHGPPSARRGGPRQVRPVAAVPPRRAWLKDRQLAAAAPDRSGPEHAGESARRTDLRLVPAALLVWATAAAGGWLDPGALGALCAVLLAGSGALLLGAAVRAREPTGAGTGAVTGDRTRDRTGSPESCGRSGSAPRSLLATAAVALLLSAVAGSHSAVASAQRHDADLAGAVAANAPVGAELVVAGAPRRLLSPGRSGLADRWAVPATLIALDWDARRIRAAAGVLVMGGPEWEHAMPGQLIRTTGKLRPAEPGQVVAAVLSASSTPRTLAAPGAMQQGAGSLRLGLAGAAGRFGGDAGGLLPGMVTGDNSRLDPQLESAMKTVGMTHLTAVSGANCSLILGALLLAARSLRFNRAFAAVLCLAGLGLFVLMVGPESSVLRAAVMGAIGLVALAGGRPGRGLSFLCLAVIGLVLAQPGLAASFGFLLSVLATLGIVVAGRPIMAWFPATVPRWLAAGLAVPLSAQAFCGPAIVLLQPQFSTYALPANMAAAGLVAPVTLLGTAAVPLVPLAPALAAVPLGTAAAFAAGVGAIARFFAGLPGAVLPWPEGAFGAATMALFSACTLAAWWLPFHPAPTVALARAAHDRTVALLNRFLPRGDGLRAPPGGSRPGVVHRPGRGRLRVCKQFSGRKPQWLLPRPHAPGPPRRTPPPGAT